MPFSKDVALQILGLPTFATRRDILLRYKVLALQYFPEKHNNTSFAVQEFSNISEAACTLLFPSGKPRAQQTLAQMYGMFQYIFFGEDKNSEEIDSLESDSENGSDCEHLQEEKEAENKAINLIMEEEKEKLRAERRRAKKKRRKERKKQQKSEQGENANGASVSSQTDQIKKSKDADLSSEEEDIDTSSAFVAVIAKKKKHVPIPDAKKETRTVPTQKSTAKVTEDPTSVVLRSRQLALRGNEMASLGHYQAAADLFSESIKLDPSDHRFYGNRSYCYDRLCQYERALKDAEKSIALCPAWPKGYFRKGRAMLGLKKYSVAEECFVKVLKLDNDCEDALAELHKVKILQIMEAGYSKEQAEAALSKYGSVKEAISNLVINGISRVAFKDDDVFLSDDESEAFRVMAAKAKKTPRVYDIKTDPNNPENHNSLWIGNVQPGVTEKKLLSMFSKFGEILSLKIMPEKFCAFVNFKSISSPGKAMKEYQGFELGGAKLIIRFPNLPGETSKKKTVVSSTDTAPKTQGSMPGDECYFWRTTGCIYGEHCRYRHVKEHEGIDKKKWHIATN
ncbi:hsc70-interacting protein-like isoform X2 [Stegodyphus dumicola]|uniref:hsc70-interacting protein-like isoform X2 n=1 Tax=Stegodyphus dumicola TaxID=202533 RepID=UPI0015B1C661|nr:hsc70-interacting protein-like isoform X2 [Stegodyphus dumicola]